jgi:PAS domain S-box-containing protein
MTTIDSLTISASDILVVDDTTDSLRLLSNILTDVGYRVRPADRPHLALQSALAHPPDLILLDVRMPEMDGFELCRRLKQNESTREIPVIFVSALRETEDKVQGFEAGGVDFVSKPFQEAEVLARVNTHLQLRYMQLHLEDLVDERTAELIRANQELRESQDRFRATFEQAAVGIAHVAIDGHFLRLNQKFCEITGYSHDQMLERTFQDITHPDDLETDLDHLIRLLAGETETYTIEKRYLRMDGEIVWVNLTVSLLRQESGEPDYFISVVEDISERKELQQERDRILNTSQDLVCIASMDGYFKYLNPAWERILGYSNAELLSRPFLDFIHPDDHARNDAEVAALAAGNLTFDFENRYICKDGSIRVISWVATPLLEDQEMYCIGRDITEQRRIEEAQRESEARFGSVFDHAPMGIAVAGVDSHIVEANDAFLRLVHGTSNELQAVDVIELSPEEDNEREIPLIQEVLAGKRDRYSLEKRFIHKDGHEVYAEIHAAAVRNEDGDVWFVIGIAQDITERKQAEGKILAYQQRLKALASQLTIAEERERRRIAAELHDHVSQSLALVRIHLSSAQKATSESRRNELLDLASQTLVEAIQDTRTLTFELSSPLLYKLGLEKAIAAWLRDQIGIPFNLETDFLDDGQEKPLTEDEQVILFRNVRELLVNVVHHAQATEIQVSIEREVANIIITVQDDGIGFDSGSALQYEYPEDGFGLFSIQERMADFGGSLEIISAPGMGCTAVLTAPLDLG